MPTIRVELLAGRTPFQKHAFMTAVTAAAVRDLGSAPEHVDVVFFDVQPTQWATGGQFFEKPRAER
jgi:4-oxalocrotonate tautomerase